MKPIKINKNSWHYKFVEEFNSSWTVRDCASFCEYLKLFWWSIVSTVLSIAAGVIIGLLLIAPLMFLFGGFVDNIWVDFNDPSPTGAFVIMGFLIYFIVPAGIISDKLQARAKAKRLECASASKQPGFFSLAWKSFREKVCFKIEFTE